LFERFPPRESCHFCSSRQANLLCLFGGIRLALDQRARFIEFVLTPMTGENFSRSDPEGMLFRQIAGVVTVMS
jgi:hypothetical protein